MLIKIYDFQLILSILIGMWILFICSTVFIKLTGELTA